MFLLNELTVSILPLSFSYNKKGSQTILLKSSPFYRPLKIKQVSGLIRKTLKSENSVKTRFPFELPRLEKRSYSVSSLYGGNSINMIIKNKSNQISPHENFWNKTESSKLSLRISPQEISGEIKNNLESRILSLKQEQDLKILEKKHKYFGSATKE